MKLDEAIRLFRSLWRGDTDFHSSTLQINFENALFEPKPVTPQIPIWIGGISKAAMKRAVILGDAWHPNVTPIDSFRKLVAQFREVSPAAKEKDICVRIGLNTKVKESEYTGATGEKRILFSGDMEQNQEIVLELEKLGVSRAVVVPSPDGKISMEAQIQSLEAFADVFLK